MPRGADQMSLVLAAALSGGLSNQDIARRLGCERHAAGKRRERYAADALQGLQDAPRSGRPRSFPR